MASAPPDQLLTSDSNAVPGEESPQVLPTYNPQPPQLDGSNLSDSLEALRVWAIAFGTREDNGDLLEDAIPDFLVHATELLTDVCNRDAARSIADTMWASILNSVGCKICYSTPPRRPVGVECGHIFCATCLRDELERQVQLAIRTLKLNGPYEKCRPLLGLICAVLPFETYEQLTRFADAVRARGIETPYPIPRYTCPDPSCHKLISHAPFFVKVIDDACRRMRGNSVPNESPVHEFRALFPM